VTVAGEVIGEIGNGMLVLLGVEKKDGDEEIEKLANKLCRYRMFNDADGKMNLNIEQVGGEFLVVSQFTLVADTQRGNRPGFSRGASPEHGEAIYKKFINTLINKGMTVATGEFGADMQVGLINDGPVTFQFNV
jgi:D-tyrosyl-tRNA(Tyr) deacylase